MNLRSHAIFFAICLSLSLIGLLTYAQDVSNDEYSSLEIEVLKKIASHSIKKALETSKNLDEAASLIGVESRELQRLCLALDIKIDFAPVEIEPVALSSSYKLTNDSLEPDVIIDYNGASPYVIIVEKSTHTLYLLMYENGKRTLIDTFQCKTGKNHGDKKISGDKKTPEGIYFLVNKYSRKDIERIVGKKNTFQYGDLAYVTNFPNAIDHLYKKNGSGIWLHGTDEPFESTSSNDTRGCVVTTNETIGTLSKYIVLRQTPLIITDQLKLLNKNDFEKRRQEALEITEGWRSSWENKRINEYINYYSPSFKSQGLSRGGWKKNKQVKWKRNNDLHVVTQNHIVLVHNGGMVVNFDQHYSIRNTSYSTTGSKTLYLISEQNTWKIIAEHFR